MLAGAFISRIKPAFNVSWEQFAIKAALEIQAALWKVA